MSARKSSEETLENIMDIREYDVPYYVRVAMDLGKSYFFFWNTSSVKKKKN